MAITVQIPTALRRHTAGVSSIACTPTNLGELFLVLDEKFPELKPHIRDETGQVRRFLNIYVNEEDIRFLGGPAYIFTETAGGVTVGSAGKLYRQDRILPEETTVLCITGNGLKTTDVLAGVYEIERPIAPKLAEFEKYLHETLDGVEVAREAAATIGA
jgi:molybdopterin converting factor small subunit